MADLAVVTAAERPDLWERASDLTDDVWPEYNLHGDVLNVFWPRLEPEFAEFQFVLYDPGHDELLAEGHTIPCAWDRTAEGLPRGIDGLIREGFELLESGGSPTALGALAIEIPPANQSRRLSVPMLEGMVMLACRHGLSDLIAPLRPSWKERYPLVPIDRYAAWTRADGLPFDPWLRVHRRLGGELIKVEPESMRITGTVDEWEAWTEMAFPESGEYVFPRGLALLTVDLAADAGAYWEPNIWVRHAIEAGS